jgi:hypothetical protein
MVVLSLSISRKRQDSCVLMAIGVLATNYWRAKRNPLSGKKSLGHAPTEGTIKINADAAFHVDQGKGSLAAVARDFKGKFLCASCKELPFMADPFMAEAYALREGLSMAQHLGVNKVVMQSASD